MKFYNKYNRNNEFLDKDFSQLPLAENRIISREKVGKHLPLRMEVTLVMNWKECRHCSLTLCLSLLPWGGALPQCSAELTLTCTWGWTLCWLGISKSIEVCCSLLSFSSFLQAKVGSHRLFQTVSFIFSFSHSLNKYILDYYLVPDTWGTWDKIMSEKDIYDMYVHETTF